MKTKKIISFILAFVLSSGVVVSGVQYLPDVTKEMSQASYWTQEDDVLMSYEEAEILNEKTIFAKGTNMYDLANLADAVDGVALNEALITSSDAGMEDVDLSGFDNDGLDALNTAVVNELEKRGVKDEWKKHLEIEPFVFREE